MSRRHTVLAVSLLAAAAVALGVWWAWNRWFSERANPSMEEFPVRGIDISAHNGDIDFALLATERPDFAYVKATEGTDFIDRKFYDNARGMASIGVPAGAYHFFRFDTDGQLQAWNFITALRSLHLQLPPAIDLEEWGNPEGETTGDILRQLRRMLAVMSDQGYTPVIYTNKDGYDRFFRRSLHGYPLWICSFTDLSMAKPTGAAVRQAAADSIGGEASAGGSLAQPSAAETYPFVLWQYSHRGSLPGIPTAVDLNCAPAPFWEGAISN